MPAVVFRPIGPPQYQHQQQAAERYVDTTAAVAKFMRQHDSDPATHIADREGERQKIPAFQCLPRHRRDPRTA